MTPLTILLPLLGVLLTQSAGATISPLNIQSDITKSRSNSFILEKTSSSTKSLNYKDILASSNRKKNTPIQQSKFQEARTSILTIVLPWLYFLSISVNMPSFPKYVNWCVNKGDSTVSPLSQKIYGDYSGLDSFFTFLAVNFIGCLSDSYGRKPFLMLSAGGLGLSYLVSLFAVRSHYLFYMSGCIDGLTSSMFAQAQAYATDWSRRQETIISKEKNRSNIGKIESVNLSDVIGRFQGLAIGCAFIIGIPLNVILTTRGSYRNPIILAVMLCAISCIGTYLFLPESLQFKKDATGKMIRKPIMWRDANPLGAMKLFLSRGSRLGLGALAYFFINLSHTGMSVVWVNYLGKRFGWSSHQAGAAFMLLGVMIIFAPKILT